ncbi:MAG TPA: proton-conducting transporter membrane subunit [Candidatus Limnocylindrales bacterium]
MTVIPFLVAAAAAGTASLLARTHRGLSTSIAVFGLIVMIATATAIGPAASIEIGGSRLAASEWLRLYAILGSLVGLLLVLVDVTALHEPDAPGVIVLGIGAAVLALALSDPGVAVVAATAGGLAGVLVAAPVGAAARAAFVGAREIRALTIAGTLSILATAWLARPLGDLVAAPAVFGAAYLAFAAAVAIRFGAIPFHLWAARVADAAPGVALPLLMAWGPAAFAAVALVWIDQSVAPLVLPFGAERALIAAVGAVSILLGLVAAWIQDDLEHVVGYTIVADAGFAVLGLAVLDPAIWEPTRVWLLVFVVARSALAAWVVAIHGGFGTRRLPELSGWARRAPGLGVALAAIAIATIGWPGLAAWEARATIGTLALPSLLAGLVTIAPVASLAIYGRILAVGLEPVGQTVKVGRGERPSWPTPMPSRPMVGLTGVERTFEKAGHAAGGALDLAWTVPAGIRRNRMGLASIAVLVLGVLAVAVAAGGLGVPAAARAVPAIVEPGPGQPTEPSEPAGSPSASDEASPAPSDGGSGEASPAAGSPGASGSPEASGPLGPSPGSSAPAGSPAGESPGTPGGSAEPSAR